MLSSFILLERVLSEIENNLKAELTAGSLARTVNISSVHLQRIFKFAFEQPIASYIRSRKLAASLSDLLMTDLRIVDIANEYGFEYEQTFIRAFKREHGLTPGDVRKSGGILKIKPPLYLSNKNRTGNGLFFGPVMVMVPEFHVVGKIHMLTTDNYLDVIPNIALQFWANERESITDMISRNEYTGMAKVYEDGSVHYYSAIRVAQTAAIPKRMIMETIPASLCVRFRYIGHHHYTWLDEAAFALTDETFGYADNENSEYLIDTNFMFGRLWGMIYDGPYCLMDYYTPITKKRTKKD